MIIETLRNGLLRYARNDGKHTSDSKYLSLRATKSRSNPFLTLITLIILCIIPCQAAIEFDGVNDYVNIGFTNTYDFERTDPFSVSVWINSDSISTQQVIIGNQDAPSTYRGWALSIYQSKLNFYARSTIPNQIDLRGTTVLSSNTWYHLVYSYNGNSNASGLKSYINSNLETMNISSDNLSTTMKSGLPVQIGILESSIAAFNGIIDDVRIYNHALTATEIEALYKAKRKRIGGSLANGLVAHYEMDDGEIGSAVSTVIDTSGNSSHGTGVGGASLRFTEGVVQR